MPHRVYHVYLSILYASAYTVFTVVYWKAGGTNPEGQPYVYSVLDWRSNPGTAALYSTLLGVVGGVVTWLSLYGLYRIKLLVYNCFCKTALVHSEDCNGKDCTNDNDAVHVTTDTALP